MAKSLYIHLPFCASKCAYCDFNSFANSEHLIDDYLSALSTELKLLSSENNHEPLSTIYIGGGTPTVLSAEQLTFLFATINATFVLADDLEYTIEANPGTLTHKKVSAIASAQINRVSLGAQAFQDHLLRGLGRIHTVADIYQAVKLLRSVGIDNISLDLMFAIPNQSIADLEESLERVIELGVPHVSAYSLMLEEGTPFYELAQQGRLNLPSEADELAMFMLTMETLAKHGYEHYEISNYASAENNKSRHNRTYWLNNEYLGAGAGAHGYLNGVRYENRSDIVQYITSLSSLQATQVERYTPTIQEQKENTLMLGLRLKAGVSLADYRARYGSELTADFADSLNKLLNNNLIIIEGDQLKLTEQGLLFANQVILELLE